MSIVEPMCITRVRLGDSIVPCSIYLTYTVISCGTCRNGKESVPAARGTGAPAGGVGGLASVGGAQRERVPGVIGGLKSREVDGVLLLCGGIIPEEDIPAVKAMGFAGVFGPGSSTVDMIDFIRENLPASRREN